MVLQLHSLHTLKVLVGRAGGRASGTVANARKRSVCLSCSLARSIFPFSAQESSY